MEGIVEFQLQFGTRHHLINVQSHGVLVQVIGHQARLALIRQPDEDDVVILHPAAWTFGAVVAGVRDDLRRLIAGAVGYLADEVGKMPGLDQFVDIDR